MSMDGTTAPDGASSRPCWTATLATPIGEARATWTVDDDALVHVTDDPFDPGTHRVRWVDVVAGGTATMAGLAVRGGPETPASVPSVVDWLLLSTRDGRGFLRRLPPGREGAELAAVVRDRLGPRWVGDAETLSTLQARLGLAPRAASVGQLVVIVAAVFALLVVAVVVVALCLTPFVLVPVAAAAGAGLVRRGRRALAAAAAASAATPIAQVRPGPTVVSGRAVVAEPTAAPITGRPCAWWDVAVSLSSRDDDGNDTWRQVAARHDGTIDVVDVDDGTGRIPVWLAGAERIVARDAWETGGAGSLPSRGVALLDTLGFRWDGTQRIRVVEERLEDGAALTVFGTVGRRGDVPPSAAPRGLAKLRASLASGSWRRTVVAAAPRPLKAPLAIAIGYVDLLARFGRGDERPDDVASTTPPAVSPDTPMVWKGPDDAPFVVAVGSTSHARSTMRKRGLAYVVAGIGALGFAAGYAIVSIVG